MINRLGLPVVLLAALLCLPACRSRPDWGRMDPPSVTMRTQYETIRVGETTELRLATANLLGRGAKVAWKTTIGTIRPSSTGRTAQFTSTVAGTAVITAHVTLNDGTSLADQESVHVKARERE